MFGNKSRHIEYLTKQLYLAAGRIDELRQMCEDMEARNERLHKAYMNLQQRFLSLHPDQEAWYPLDPPTSRPYVAKYFPHRECVVCGRLSDGELVCERCDAEAEASAKRREDV